MGHHRSLFQFLIGYNLFTYGISKVRATFYTPSKPWDARRKFFQMSDRLSQRYR